MAGLPSSGTPQVENPDFPKIQRSFPFRNLHSRVPIARLRELEAGARESISVINYAATYSHAITHAMGELHQIILASLADNRAFAPPAHTPVIAKIQKDVEAQIDTMYSALVRLSQANETILSHALHTMGMTTLWRREAVMANLSPDLERSRRQALRNSSFLEPGLFDPKLISEAESYLLAAQAQPRRRRRNRSPRSNRGSHSSSSAPRRSQSSPRPFFQGDHQIQQQQSFRGSGQSVEPPAVDAGVVVASGGTGTTTTKTAAKVTLNDNIPVSGITGVGGRLTHYLKTWIAHGLGDWLTDMLRHGYRLPFQERPPLTRQPSVGSGYNNADKDSALRLVITELLSKNAITRVQDSLSLGFYSRLFLVPNPEQRWRPVIDLRNLNGYLRVQTFKMETPETIRA